MPTETTYSSAQVAPAAGISLDNFRAQFTRDHWRLFSNDRPENGKAHRFTLGEMMAYALARRLTDAGFAPGDAFSVAIFGLDQTAVDEYFGRKGRLFDDTKGRTFFLAVHGNSNVAPYGRWFSSKDNEALETLFLPKGGSPANSHKEQVVLVDLTALRDRVLSELGETETA